MKIAKPQPETQKHDALAGTLLANLAAFQSFARGRLHDDALAADAVQESLLRALKFEEKLSHDENLLAWFYRILRNVLNDLHRRRARQETALQGFAEHLAATNEKDHALENLTCRCFRDLLPTLRPDYARVLELVDLGGQSQESAADALGLSRSNLKVRLHRARRQLRDRLEQTCRTCTTHGCLDCTCEGAHNEE
jgi:RNA polymerase sigma-70 factor (ECF subfamily)